MNSDEGLDVVEEFYSDENVETEQPSSNQVQQESKPKTRSKLKQVQEFVQEMQQGLQGSVRAVN